MKNIIILGGATGALEVKGIIDDINKIEYAYNIIGILDDNPDMQGVFVDSVPVIGTLSDAAKYNDAKFIFAIGSIKTKDIRKKIMERINISIENFETIIHPSAIVNKTAKLGGGCIIHPRVTISNDVSIGNFTVIAVATTLAPYVKIGNYAMITSHVLLLTNVEIGESVFVAAGSCVVENVKIGSHARIGVGTIVGRDVPDNYLCMGNPGRLIKENS